jgi:hypothetical protein
MDNRTHNGKKNNNEQRTQILKEFYKLETLKNKIRSSTSSLREWFEHSLKSVLDTFVILEDEKMLGKGSQEGIARVTEDGLFNTTFNQSALQKKYGKAHLQLHVSGERDYELKMKKSAFINDRNEVILGDSSFNPPKPLDYVMEEESVDSYGDEKIVTKRILQFEIPGVISQHILFINKGDQIQLKVFRSQLIHGLGVSVDGQVPPKSTQGKYTYDLPRAFGTPSCEFKYPGKQEGARSTLTQEDCKKEGYFNFEHGILTLSCFKNIQAKAR